MICVILAIILDVNLLFSNDYLDGGKSLAFKDLFLSLRDDRKRLL